MESTETMEGVPEPTGEMDGHYPPRRLCKVP